MSYNILLDSNIYNTTSGIPSISGTLELSFSQLEDLTYNRAGVVLASGNYIGLGAQFGMNMVCHQANVYSSHIDSGVVQFHYKEFLGNVWSNNGIYNYSTDYSTPRMTSDFDPDPYTCSGTTTWDPVWYAAYKSFNQTCNDSLDCWLSGQGTPGYPPQSIMFYFPYGKVINKYAFQARNHATLAERNFPKVFSLQGNIVSEPLLTNDSHWVTLDYRQGVGDPGQSAWSSYFTFDNNTSYNYYRLKVTESNGSRVSVANIKLVEAGRAESISSSMWYSQNMDWDGSSYVYSFPGPTGVEEIKFFIGTSSGTVSVSGIELLVPTNFVSVSGVVASGIYIDNHLLTHRTLDPFIMRLQNLMPGNAKPHLLFKYTGSFDIDRNIFVSPDYSQCHNKDDAIWYGLDYGYTVPEIDSFESGVFLGTKLLGREVILNDDETEGEWRSPVIDTNNKSVVAYTYSAGNATTYIRASETPPPLVNFLIVATDSSHRWLMYDHKRVYIDSTGRTIGYNECNPPIDGSKLWRVADFDWAGSDLMYYGAINERGTAAFLAPGYLECGDTSPEQEFNLPDYWYNLNICTLDDDSQWAIGTTVSGLPYGSNFSVLYTKLFSVKDSDGFFCFTIVYDSVQQVSTLSLSFQWKGYTQGSYPLLVINGSISPSSNIDIAYDAANGGWWVYLLSNLYKVDAGSINNVRIFSPTPGMEHPDTLRGYIWKTTIDQTWKSLVSIPSQDYNYFWAFNDTTAYLYEEKYELSQPEIIQLAEITTGVQVESEFLGFSCGSCDSYGNVWLLDLVQERVIRVNMQRALEGDSRAVDYENQIAGVMSLWAHPTDGTCFLLISDEPEHPEQDIIRMVHANQRWGSQGKYVCAVPGTYSKPYAGSVFFTGRSFSGAVRPHESDVFWGNNTLEADGSTNTSNDYATPAMTSNTQVLDLPSSYVISATYANSDAYKSFDRVYGFWRGDGASWQALMVQFPEPTLINKYAFYTSINYTNYWPARWEIQVPKDGYETSALISNDTHWVTLDSRSTPCPAFEIWTPYYTFINTKLSTLYRIRLTTTTINNPNAYVAVGEIKLVKAQETAAWIKYESGRALPRGRYKQIKVELSRPNIDIASPRLQKVRLPKPIALEPLGYQQETEIALKSTLNKVRTPGDWDTKLQVWWFNEEI